MKQSGLGKSPMIIFWNLFRMILTTRDSEGLDLVADDT